MEVSLLDLAITAITANTKAVTKLKRYYDRNKERLDIFAKDKRLDITKTEGMIKTIILSEERINILSVIGDCFTIAINNIKKGIRYQQTLKENVNIYEVTKMFALYKFLELLTDNWQDYDSYESELIALVYHNVHKTKMGNVKPEDMYNFLPNVNEDIIAKSMNNMVPFFSFVYDILLDSDIDHAKLFSGSLTAKEKNDIYQRIVEMIFTNTTKVFVNKTTGLFSLGNKENKYSCDMLCALSQVGAILKFFAKMYHKKEQELISAQSRKEIVIKEDIASKKLLKDKQDALNNLQIQYDKQQEKLAAVSEELEQIKEYVDIVEKLQKMEEDQSSDQQNDLIVPHGKGIVLFGGHPNYQRKFKEKYSWVKVVPAEEVHVDWNLVRNANLVLINWKHLTHRQFYKLISLIREHKKEYRYVV